MITDGIFVRDLTKTIHDAVHGDITVSGVFLDLMESPEFQRLHDIRQLGMAYLVFPGAHHTRLEHSLGTYHIAGMMCRNLELDETEAMEIKCAALLHDIGHAPFSHTLEWLLKDRFGFTHDELARSIITGDADILPAGEIGLADRGPTVPEILERYGLVPERIANLISKPDPHEDPDQTTLFNAEAPHFSKDNYPRQMLHGPIDCDQMDYLMRDSHNTGVAHGVIDRDRLLNTIAILNGNLVVEYSGISAVEGMLVARALMYTTVYFHKTVRIAELMLAKAAENLNKREIDSARKQNDSGFLAILKNHDESSRRIITSLKYRRLYKTALAIAISDLRESDVEALSRLCDYGEKQKLESVICRRAGIPPGSVVLDVPGEEILTTEPRLSNVGIGIMDGLSVRPLSRISPLASSLQLRKVQDWALKVACPREMIDDVRTAAKSILGHN